MNVLKKRIINTTFLIVFLFLTEGLLAQCPMCRMTAESNLANGGVDGEGLNKGILFLLATPYLLIGTIAYSWWRNKKKEDEFDVE